MKSKIIILFLSVFVIAGCAHDHDHDYDHDHDHAHNETLHLTAYNSDYEVYVEATPFVAGQASDVLAHFSFLGNFKPLTDGSVTVSLVIGANETRQTLEQPTRPGIYQFSLLPAAAGNGSMVFDIKTPEGSSQIVIPDITVYTNEHDAHEAAAKAALVSVNGAVFTKEQSWKVDFATAAVRREPFGQIIRATGQIQPSHGDELIITTRASGVVSFANSDITMEGKAVSANQALFSIDGSDMVDNDFLVRHTEAVSGFNRARAELDRARTELDRAKAELGRARTELDRRQELAKEYIVSQSDLLRTRMDYTNAETNLANAETDIANAETNFAAAEAVYNNSLRRNFATGKYVVNSPVSGFVTRVLARNGEYVEAGQAVLVVSQHRDLLIRAELQPRYFDMLNRITSANIRMLNNNSTYALEELGGRMVSYGKAADIANPLIPVLFQVNNRAGLLPGGFVEMFIKTQISAQAITVPNEAIIEEMGNYFVFVQLTPEFFEKRAVKKSATDGIRTEITEGISESDRVVSKGAILVKLAQGTGALDPHAGHAH